MELFGGESISKQNVFWMTPSKLYKDTKMNKFGCWFVSILIYLIAPINSIGIFVYWITHVGRNK